MPSKPLRNIDYLYTIKSYSDYGFSTGITEDGQQVLFGVVCPYHVIVFFDKDGCMVNSVIRLLAPESEFGGSGPRYEDDNLDLHLEIAALEREFAVTPGPIRVLRFHVRFPESEVALDPWDYDGVGIEDVPWHYSCFLLHCVDAAPDDSLPHDLQVWLDRGDFVLWWGNDFDVNIRGDVVSS